MMTVLLEHSLRLRPRGPFISRSPFPFSQRDVHQQPRTTTSSILAARTVKRVDHPPVVQR